MESIYYNWILAISAESETSLYRYFMIGVYFFGYLDYYAIYQIESYIMIESNYWSEQIVFTRDSYLRELVGTHR